MLHSCTSTVTSNSSSRVRSWDPLTPLCSLGNDTGPAHFSQADKFGCNTTFNDQITRLFETYLKSTRPSCTWSKDLQQISDTNCCRIRALPTSALEKERICFSTALRDASDMSTLLVLKMCLAVFLHKRSVFDTSVRISPVEKIIIIETNLS